MGIATEQVYLCNDKNARLRALLKAYFVLTETHSSEGQTADRVLINIDTQLGDKDLINKRMAYVSASREAHVRRSSPLSAK
jgi:hypothetical protein